MPFNVSFDKALTPFNAKILRFFQCSKFNDSLTRVTRLKVALNTADPISIIKIPLKKEW